ncbi:MAG: hypothetical protein AB7W59_00275 [Acidimicrobiia bacterium]
MKHAEKVEMLARVKRDVAHAEEQRDSARAMSEKAEQEGEREWQRGVATAWAGIRERLLSLQRFVVSLPIDDLDTIVGAGEDGEQPKVPKKAAKKVAKAKAASPSGRRKKR